MSEVFQVIAELSLKLHPDRLEAIAVKIGSLDSYKDFQKARSSFGPGVDPIIIERLELAWEKSKRIRPSELAAAIRGAYWASRLHKTRSSAELVWSGPSTSIVPVRHTEQVLGQVIRSASNRLYLVSYVAYKVDSIVNELISATERGVSINMILESSKEHGGTVDYDSVKAMKNSVPAAKIYVWKKTGQSVGSVHAKCVVADGELSFITSANFTAAAMERNMELGVLVKGGPIPHNLDRHIEALIYTGLVQGI
ncbi:DISARM system phospholipase D-like protein DrmC [Paenibacillus polymyxa]|uniref:DISARM system phospholipase D-like protein DrmC n=1 Tax=Paenibacillus polymyxa TaxID=1406 RepID=UPI003D272A35